MVRKDIVKNLVIVFGFILLVLTLIEFLIRALSITPDPFLSYLSALDTFYLVSILVFLILLVVFIEVRNR